MGKTKTNNLPDTDDNKQLANKFADYFIAKIEKICEDLLDSPKFVPVATTTSRLSSFSNVSSDAVLKMIRTAKPTTCPTDPIPSTIIKENSDIIVSLITSIINKSLQYGTFYDKWKMATVTPLLKKSDLQPQLQNYRPVSNLSYISKIVERSVVSQLNSYLTANNLQSGHQSAYKESFSTETALCSLIDELLWSMEKGRANVLVSLDLSAAFDTVDHQILLDVLGSNYGISETALHWISSYLMDRKLSVIIKDCSSDIKSFNFSVPQGSCLGPVLFNLYSSTIVDCVAEGQSLGGYADDHCIIDSFDPASEDEEEACVHRLESSLNKISTWMASNRLKMNPAKTEVTVFASKNTANKITTTSIEVANEPVPTSDLMKYLGVWFDSQLTLDKHISSKCSSAIYNIRNIASIRRFINLDTAKLLATSLVLTHLDYSNSILAGLPKKSISKMQRVQNWAAKVVLYRDKYSSSTEALIQLHWLPVKERIDFKILCIIFKCLNRMAPSYLSSKIKVKQFPKNTRASAIGLTLEVPYVRKSTFAARAFSVYGPKLWNSLEPKLQKMTSIDSFKRCLKTELFKRAFKSNLTNKRS